MLFLRSYSCEFLSKCIREKKQHLLYFMLNRFLIHAKFSSLTSNAQSNVQSIMVSSIFASFAQLNIRWDWDHFVRIFVYFFFCYTFCCFICVSLSRCFCPLFFLAIKRFYVWQKMKWRHHPKMLSEKIHSLTTIEMRRNEAKPLISLFILLNIFYSRCNFRTGTMAFDGWPICRMFDNCKENELPSPQQSKRKSDICWINDAQIRSVNFPSTLTTTVRSLCRVYHVMPSIAYTTHGRDYSKCIFVSGNVRSSRTMYEKGFTPKSRTFCVGQITQQSVTFQSLWLVRVLTVTILIIFTGIPGLAQVTHNNNNNNNNKTFYRLLCGTWSH